MLSDHRLSVVIPAAGSSQRLGQAKQLIKVSGKPLLQVLIDRAASFQPFEIIVVTGASTDKIQSSIVHQKNIYTQLKVIDNPNWKDGIGSSIAVGVSTVSNSAKGVMILLADQWKIQSIDLHKLASVWEQDCTRLAVSHTEHYLGPPAIFPRDCFRVLTELNGDEGARKVILANTDRLQKVKIVNAVADLDTPQDLDILRSAQRTD